MPLRRDRANSFVFVGPMLAGRSGKSHRQWRNTGCQPWPPVVPPGEGELFTSPKLILSILTPARLRRSGPELVSLKACDTSIPLHWPGLGFEAYAGGGINYKCVLVVGRTLHSLCMASPLHTPEALCISPFPLQAPCVPPSHSPRCQGTPCNSLQPPPARSSVCLIHHSSHA